MANPATATAKAPASLAVLEREARALELRKGGANYDQIGRALGISPGRAGHIVRRALTRLVQEPAEELVTLEVARLDALLTAMWPKAMKGDAHAVDRCLSVMERRAKLLGLDKPTRIDADVRHREVSELDAEIEQLLDTLS